MGNNTSDRDDPKSEKHPDDPATNQPDGDEPESQRPMSIRIKQAAPNAVGIETEPHKKQRDALDWLNFVILVFAMVAATFAAVYTGQEVEVARKTLKEVREGTRKELRAYVLPHPFRHVNGVEPNKSVQTAVRFQNSGQTPASNMEFRARVAVRGEPPDPKQIILFSDTPRRRTDTDVAPSTDIRRGDTFNAEKRLTPEQFEAVKTGKDARFYVWGAINYDDVFGLPHHSYFCFYYQGFVRSPDRGMGSPFTDYCPHPKND